jgi:hypothetical protein
MSPHSVSTRPSACDPMPCFRAALSDCPHAWMLAGSDSGDPTQSYLINDARVHSTCA